MPQNDSFARRKLVIDPDAPRPKIGRADFVELGVSSPFSFLRGASDSIELVLTALELGMDSIGIADRNTLAGVVRMHSACKGAGLRPCIGCRLDLNEERRPSTSPGTNGINLASKTPFVSSPSATPAAPLRRSYVETRSLSLLAYPIDRDGYGRLSTLLSRGKMRSDKGECQITLEEVAAHAEGIAFILWPDDDLDRVAGDLERARAAIPNSVPPRRLPLLSRRRPPADRAARPDRAGPGLHDPGHQRRPLSRARPAAAAGRDDLHPRESDLGQGRLSAQPQCRAAFEVPGKKWRGCSRAGRTPSARRATSPMRSISASTN